MKNPIKYILVADEDTDDYELLKEAFRKLWPDCRVEQAVSEPEVFSHLEGADAANLPQLIVLDYSLPYQWEANLAATLQAHAAYSRIPVVVWSSGSLPQLAQTSRQKGARGFFVKPHHITHVAPMAAQMWACAGA